MKNLYTSKKFQKLTFVFAAFLSLGLVMTSCKKDEDNNPYTDHTVGFEVKSIPGEGAVPPTGGGPMGVLLKSVTTQVGTEPSTILFKATDPPVVSWFFGDIGSDVTDGAFYVNSSKSAVYLSSNGTALDPKAKLVTNIYIDGELKKTDTAKATGIGAPIVSQVKYSFIGLQ